MTTKSQYETTFCTCGIEHRPTVSVCGDQIELLINTKCGYFPELHNRKGSEIPFNKTAFSRLVFTPERMLTILATIAIREPLQSWMKYAVEVAKGMIDD